MLIVYSGRSPSSQERKKNSAADMSNTFMVTFINEVIALLHPVRDAVNMLQVILGDLMLFVLPTGILQDLR